MKFTQHSLLNCPACKAEIDAAASPNNPKATAKPGVVTMCLYCGALLRYTRTMQLRIFTEREYNRASPDTKKLFAKMEQARQHVMSDYTPPVRPS